MKKQIALVAGDVTNGVTFQRGHMIFRYMRDEFDFKCYHFDELTHIHLLYADAIIMFHPYKKSQLQFVHRSRFHYQIPVIVDIDDLLSDLPTDHPAYRDFKENSVEDILALASKVVVSTQFLRNEFGRLNSNIDVIENTIDPARYGEFNNDVKPYHSGFVVGWTGSTTHVPDLHNTGFVMGLAEAMRAEESIRAYFHLYCPQTLIDEFGSRVIFNESAVDYMDYPSMCYTYPFDICCVPLHNHPFNHAKSDLRLLDMAPFEIPILASPVAEFKRHDCLTLVEDNSWGTKILEAFRNRPSAERMKRYVYENRTVDKAVGAWRKLLASV